MEIQRTSATLLARPGSQHADLSSMNIPWVESPFFPKLLIESGLEQRERSITDAFARDGYVLFTLERSDTERLCTEIIDAVEEQYQDKGRVQDAWRFSESVKELATDAQVDRMLRLLYQREPIPFQTLNFAHGTEQPAHSDTIHFHSVPHRFMAGVWVALEDVDEQNGPLFVYPGSHRLPLWNFHDLGLPSGVEQYDEYEKCLAEIINTLELERKLVTMRKGQALIWAANILHGGAPILDPRRTRHSQVTHYYFTDCLYYTPMLSDPYIGNVHLRTIVNIRTGRVVPNMYNGVPVQFHNLQEEIRTLQERNRRVEADKAWETSVTRRLIITVCTYLTAVVFLLWLGSPQFALLALVPAGGICSPHSRSRGSRSSGYDIVQNGETYFALEEVALSSRQWSQLLQAIETIDRMSM